MGEAKRRKLLDPTFGQSKSPLKDISWIITPADGQPDLTGDRTLAWFTLRKGKYEWQGHVFESDETDDGIGFLSQAYGPEHTSTYLTTFKVARPSMAAEVHKMLARSNRWCK